MSEENRFNPREHLMQIKSRAGSSDYLPVQWRLVWVNDEVDRAVAAGQEVKLNIDTEEVDCDLDKEFSGEVFVWNNEKRRSEKVVKIAKGYAKYKATVTLQIGKMTKRASATKSERAVDFPDFIEKANTGAVGRALAMIGFGTQFAPELEENDRIVDAPVDRTPANHGSNNANGNSAPRDENAEATITEQQIASIRKLCEHLGKSEPDNVTSLPYLAAKQLIQQLTAEYKESRQDKKPEPASAELLASARQMYQRLEREVPADLNQKSAHVVKTLIEQMTGQYRDLLNQKNGHGEATQPTSTENAPDALSLRKRCSQMRVNWDDLLTTHLGAVKTLDNIIPEECAGLKQALDIIEETRDRKSQPEQKAS